MPQCSPIDANWLHNIEFDFWCNTMKCAICKKHCSTLQCIFCRRYSANLCKPWSVLLDFMLILTQQEGGEKLRDSRTDRYVHGNACVSAFEYFLWLNALPRNTPIKHGCYYYLATHPPTMVKQYETTVKVCLIKSHSFMFSESVFHIFMYNSRNIPHPTKKGGHTHQCSGFTSDSS